MLVDLIKKFPDEVLLAKNVEGSLALHSIEEDKGIPLFLLLLFRIIFVIPLVIFLHMILVWLLNCVYSSSSCGFGGFN